MWPSLTWLHQDESSSEPAGTATLTQDEHMQNNRYLQYNLKNV